MRLYYYTAKQWGMKSLWERRLKVAKYADLNDPFELLPFQQANKDARSQINMVVEVLSQHHGIICLSESWQTTLMWAHYADKHYGMCLGFEVEESESLTKIEYQEKRLPSPIDFNLPHNGITQEMLAKCLNVKHGGWEYEREWRLRVQLNDCRDGLYYYPFNSSMQLREVIIGARSTLSIVDVAEAIGPRPIADVTIWTARPAHKSFNMCRNHEKPRKVIKGMSPAQRENIKLADALERHGEQKPVILSAPNGDINREVGN